MAPPPARARADDGPPVAGPCDVLVNVQAVGERRKPGGGLEPIAVARRLTVLEIATCQHGHGPVRDQPRERPAGVLDRVERRLRDEVEVDGVVHVPEGIQLVDPDLVRRASRPRGGWWGVPAVALLRHARPAEGILHLGGYAPRPSAREVDVDPVGACHETERAVHAAHDAGLASILRAAFTGDRRAARRSAVATRGLPLPLRNALAALAIAALEDDAAVAALEWLARPASEPPPSARRWLADVHLVEPCGATLLPVHAPHADAAAAHAARALPAAPAHRAIASPRPGDSITAAVRRAAALWGERLFFEVHEV